MDASTPTVLVALLLVSMAPGRALTVPPLTTAMMDAASADRAGLAAAVLNSARRVAGGLAIAVFGFLVSDGFETGLRVGLVLGSALLALTATAAPGLRTRRRVEGDQPPPRTVP
ncbi:hypothetical protein ACFYRN_34215 [Streptomyces sp. NPDC005227]|uniref:hypothetical protein n=1 Tax=Streptomyces sp. NPDC005227 TaxID=3364707 RepID=UPI0036BD2B72